MGSYSVPFLLFGNVTPPHENATPTGSQVEVCTCIRLELTQADLLAEVLEDALGPFAKTLSEQQSMLVPGCGLLTSILLQEPQLGNKSTDFKLQLRFLQ